MSKSQPQNKRVNISPIESVHEPEGFLYRGKELGAVVDAIDGGRSVIVLGERRMGKTSLVNVAKAALDAMGYNTIWVPCRLSYETFITEVISAILLRLPNQLFDDFLKNKVYFQRRGFGLMG